MLDFRDHKHSKWDPRLAPKGYGSFEIEPFEAWWERVSNELGNLCTEICEQWIYRHWDQSPMNFIPLRDLRWHEETWFPEDFMDKVKSWRSNEKKELDPQHDFNSFHKWPNNPTSSALDSGAWDYAPVLLSTPFGFIDTLGLHIDANYLLVEGHQRRRYLNALLHQGKTLLPQRVLILEGWPS